MTSFGIEQNGVMTLPNHPGSVEQFLFPSDEPEERS